eukprot:gene11223-15063_t
MKIQFCAAIAIFMLFLFDYIQSLTERVNLPQPQSLPDRDKCTAIIVGKKATIDGSALNSHNSDCAECDWRINLVPAKDHSKNAMRPIYLITGAYPRQVREDRGKTWSASNLERLPQKEIWSSMKGEILGYIPEVAHTYQLIEGGYGIMNEFQVAIGESTCAAKFFAAPIGPSGNGKALLEVSELSQIALERCKTAKEAILMMGDLAMKYGYYSAEWDTSKYGEAYAMGEGGEALTVTDPNEAWVFHIIPDDTGASAIWVAQRVPDDHISVVANTFIIREVMKDSPDFLYSSNLWSVAEKLGWWNPSMGNLNFLKTYAPERYHPNYSNRRVWRVLSLAAPDLNLPVESDPLADVYPFSVKVTRPEGLLAASDVMRMLRDHYEGTPISLTEGLAAGPYHDPNRFDVWGNGNMTVWDAMEGEFPRAISLFRTSYSFVTQSRRNVPNELALLWMSQYAPDSSVYTPMYVSADALPPSWIRGSLHRYTSSSAWWNFCVLGNYAARFYMYAMQPIRIMQSKFDKEFTKLVHELESNIIKQMDDSLLLSSSSSSTSSASSVRSHVKKLLTEFTIEQVLLTRFRDGYIIQESSLSEDATIKFTRIFYPKWWLEAVVLDRRHDYHGYQSINVKDDEDINFTL